MKSLMQIKQDEKKLAKKKAKKAVKKTVKKLSKSVARAKFNKLIDVYFEVALWLYENKNSLKQKLKKNEDEEAEEYEEYGVFDYPDYGGMPKKLSNQLSSALVDRIQDMFDGILEARTFEQVVECLVEI